MQDIPCTSHFWLPDGGANFAGTEKLNVDLTEQEWDPVSRTTAVSLGLYCPYPLPVCLSVSWPP